MVLSGREAAVKENGVKVRCVLNTHGHFDHVGANKAMKATFGAPIAIHPKDASLMAEAHEHGIFFGDRFFGYKEDYKGQITPHWLADNASFWYRNDLTGNTKEFILPAALGAKPQDFLEGNDIRMKGRQDLGDPSGHDPAIHPATPVNVIGHYPNVENGLRSGNVWYRAGHG